jgi:CrcB protein
MALLLATAAAGGAGAVAARLVHRLLGSAFPWGTLLVNVTRCLALGILAGSGAPGAPWDRVLGVGLLGGYTTYSTFNHETPSSRSARSCSPG